MCDANYPLGHYHSWEKPRWQKGFKGKGLNFHQQLQQLFCGIDKEQMKPMHSVGQKKNELSRKNRKWLSSINVLPNHIRLVMKESKVSVRDFTFHERNNSKDFMIAQVHF